MDKLQTTVLIVDDVDLNREMLSDFLEILDYGTVTASNGLEALEHIATGVPDLILLDIEMPVLDGFGVLAALKENDEHRHIPVIMISGRDEVSNIARCIELGATDFLAKPFNPTILEARLTSSLEKKQLRDRERELLSDLDKSYRSLQEAEQSRDALVHMIVHDLSSPLSVIRMNTEMMTMAGTTDDRTTRALENITRAAFNMNRLVQEMLDVSKLENGTMGVELSSLEVTPFLTGLSEDFQQLAVDRGLSVVFDVDPGLVVLADHMLLARMIQNLITNAIRYASEATTIVLSASSHEVDRIVLSVRDDGMGIPEKDRHRIFDKYYQVESQEAVRRIGVGLGLSFCKLAAGAQNGSIGVFCQGTRGTDFRIELPAA